MLISILYDCKLCIFGFWTVVQTKQDIWVTFGPLGLFTIFCNKTHYSHSLLSSYTYVSFSPQRRAPIPPCHRTPVSTTRQRYLINCPVSRPSGLSWTHRVIWRPARSTRVAQIQERTSAMATCPEDSKTRHLHSRSGIWSCVFRGRETPGGTAYNTLLKLASSLSASYSGVQLQHNM